MVFRRLILSFIPLVISCCFSLDLKAQKYYFQHYDIGDGLIQSQVTSICQDNNKQIWLTTLGGINCFDSKQFSAFTIEDGLPVNSCFSLTKDKEGKIWTGNSAGLTEFQENGIKLISRKDKSYGIVGMLLCDSQNNVWALRGKHLYKLTKGQLQLQTVVPDNEWVTIIRINSRGEIFAAVAKKGIYKLENNRWKIYCSVVEKPEIDFIEDFIFDNLNPDLLYFITRNSLYSSTGGLIKNESQKLFKSPHPGFTCLLSDKDNGLWIGTDNGACLLKNGAVTWFNDKNGFTNVRVFCMLKDADNQIWFGTDGAGLFKYQNNTFLVFDKSQGLDNEVVMTLAKGKNDEVYIGSNGGKLLCYKDQQMVDLKLPRSKMLSSRINYLFQDHNNNLWIGTDNSGLWLKKGSEYSKIYPKEGDPPYVIFTTIHEDGARNLWFTASNGCYYLEDNKLVKIKKFSDYCSSMIEIGKDSFFVGTNDGVKLIIDKSVDTKFPGILAKEQINCLEYRKPFLIAATNELGVFIYNLKTKSTQKISTRNGLSSNAIYSMLRVNDELWIGTGRGVSKYKLAVNGNECKLNLIPIVGLPFECNENAILKFKNDIWVGTTHGINVYPIFYSASSNSITKIVIENIQTYTKNLKDLRYSYFNGYKLPGQLTVPSAESHIAIKFQAIDFNASKTQYQYMLDGLDNAYSKPSQNSFVDYPNLPPGDYVFKVRPVTANNSLSGTALYRFTVKPEFYQTILFNVGVILLLVSIIISIYFYKIYLNKQKLNFIHRLKLQEQENVRRQTGEDFHDDLGNKLTRINMLSELLDKKMSSDLTEEKKLTRQIRSSAVEMYAGTKSILWALNPQNDHLNEVLKEVEKFGYSIFENTGIAFSTSPYKQATPEIKLPLGYSHNITLIFKELMNNILKHSDANVVTFSYELTSYNKICLAIADNGKGYDVDALHEGNGMKNVQNRTRKLNGELIVDSRPGKGTITKLIINTT